jgi:two-component system, OmpR family, response regulator MprA
MRLLVVDDDEQIRRSLATALGRVGFEVTAVHDAAPAVRLAPDEHFDLVVADYHMQSGPGTDVVRCFKQRWGARVFCVILTGAGDVGSGDADELRAHCRAAGADAVLLKPVPLAELRSTLFAAAAALRDAS